MKLYTEEQVIAGFMLFVGISEDNAKKVIELVTPIELPSEEEIEKQAICYDNQVLSETPPYHFINGVKWVKNKIKNQQ